MNWSGGMRKARISAMVGAATPAGATAINHGNPSVVPRHTVEAEAAPFQPHDVEPRPALRQIERDIAAPMRAVAERHADRAERRKSFGREVDDLQFRRAHATAACSLSNSGSAYCGRNRCGWASSVCT